MMMQSLSSNAEQWSRDLTRLPDQAPNRLQRENSMLAEAISCEQERRLDNLKYRRFRVRCMIPAFVDQSNSDDDDSPGEMLSNQD